MKMTAVSGWWYDEGKIAVRWYRRVLWKLGGISRHGFRGSSLVIAAHEGFKSQFDIENFSITKRKTCCSRSTIYAWLSN